MLLPAYVIEMNWVVGCKGEAQAEWTEGKIIEHGLFIRAPPEPCRSGAFSEPSSIMQSE